MSLVLADHAAPQRGRGAREVTLEDCIVEDGETNVISVMLTGKATISGTKVRRNGKNGVQTMGKTTIMDSTVTANGYSGMLTWKQDEGCKAICTIGDTVECSGNNTDNRTRRTTSCCSTERSQSRS